MANNPLVSVVMPAYNAEKFIDQAILSILDQTYKNFEFIIIDDGSKDSTLEVIKKYKDSRIVLLRNQNNVGVIRSLNKGIARARGKYIVRMDADDWSYPERIEKQITLMQKYPNLVVSGSNIEICDENLIVKFVRKYNQSDSKIRSRMFRYSPFAHPATIWRARDLKEEKYDTKALNVEDYELYFRIGKRGRFENIELPLLRLRMHDMSISHTMNNRQSAFTIQIRWDAAKKYGYRMSLSDIIYNILQATVVRLMPVRLRFWLFNFLRQFEAY